MQSQGFIAQIAPKNSRVTASRSRLLLTFRPIQNQHWKNVRSAAETRIKVSKYSRRGFALVEEGSQLRMSIWLL
jgi:hypothetical protein